MVDEFGDVATTSVIFVILILLFWIASIMGLGVLAILLFANNHPIWAIMVASSIIADFAVLTIGIPVRLTSTNEVQQ